MIIDLEINRKFMRELGSYAFFVLSYYKAFYEKTGMVSSITQAAKDLGMSYLKTRASLARIYYILTESKCIKNINVYNFIRDRARGAYETESRRNKKRKEKGIEERILWKSIVSSIQDHSKKKISTGFYWKTQAWMNSLIKKIGKEKIEDYTKWFIENKLDIIDSFNAGIFSCDSMIAEYLKRKHNDRRSSSRKRIKDKQDKFKSHAIKQDKEMLCKILKKKSKGELDIYDKEMLKHLREKGVWDGKTIHIE